MRKHYIWLFALIAVLFVTNFTRNTYLIGWDNLQVELSSITNLRRNFFAVWQEYQGLGLVGGHGHAVEFIRTLLTLPLILLLPDSWVRYTTQFIYLLIGTVFTYKLLKTIIPKNTKHKDKLSLIGSVFYILNLGTLQTFYQPFEPFSAFYAFLPLSILTTMKYLKKPSRKNAAWLFIALILLSFGYHNPVLFVVWGIFMLPLVLAISFKQKTRMKKFHSLAGHGLITFAANLYWLFPFLYFYFNKTAQRFDSQIIRNSSTDAFLMGNEYGTVQDLSLLRGFWFSYIDYFPKESVQFTFMYQPWIDWIGKSWVTSIGHILFVFIILGFIKALRKRSMYDLFFAYGLALSVFFLIGTNRPTGFLYSFLLDKLPVFAEAFRFAFTKVIYIAIISSAYLLVQGVAAFSEIKNLKKYKKRIYSACVVFLLIFMLPAFKGQFIYKEMKQTLPPYYQETFDYFDNQPKSKRIATLPAHSFWGWEFHDWGYRGSGFIWYGIEQPILSRTFDVWNIRNEQFYHEFQYAIYSENGDLLSHILNKYQVDYLLLDKSIIAPQADRALFTKQTEELLKSMENVSLAETFGQINIYAVKLTDAVDNFVYAPVEFLAIGADYTFSNVDSAFLSSQTSNYYLSSAEVVTKHPFTDDKRLTELYVNSTKDSPLQIENPASDTKKDTTYTLKTPKLNENGLLPATLSLKSTTGTLNFLYPQVIDAKGEVIWQKTLTKGMQFLPSKNPKVLVDNTEVEAVGFGTNVLVGFDSEIIFFDDRESTTLDYSDYVYSAEVTDCLGGEGVYGKEYDKYPGSVKLKAKDKNACLGFSELVKIEQPSLLEISFDYKSTTGSRAMYCLWSNTEEKCLNKKYLNSPVASAKGDRYVGYVYVNMPTELKFLLILETDDQSKPHEATFKDIKLTTNRTLGISKIIANSDFETGWDVVVTNDQFPLTVVFPEYRNLSRTYVAGDKHFNDEALNCDNFEEKEFSRTREGDSYKYESIDAISCDTIDTRVINPWADYVITLDSQNVFGKGLDICFAGISLDKCLLQDRLSGGAQSFMLPSYPAAESIAIRVGNQSIGTAKTVNVLNSVSADYIPYTWLKGLSIRPTDLENLSKNSISVESVNKNSVYKYFVKIKKVVEESESTGGFFVLNQSFDNGWTLYDKDSCRFNLTTPLTCKKVDSKHVLAKNWANGWIVPAQDAHYVVIFWPQYLQFAGHAVLAGFIGFLGLNIIIRRKRKRSN